jgi:hypothetical protein
MGREMRELMEEKQRSKEFEADRNFGWVDGTGRCRPNSETSAMGVRAKLRMHSTGSSDMRNGGARPAVCGDGLQGRVTREVMGTVGGKH